MTSVKTLNKGIYKFREFGVKELPLITEFINSNYTDLLDGAVMHYPQAYILKSLLIDESLPPDIKEIQPKLCMGISHQRDNTIEAIVIARPTRISLKGELFIGVVVSLLCTNKDKRHLLLGPKLIQELQKKLMQANLLKYALCTGTHLPYPKIQIATEKIVFICSDSQHYTNWYAKANNLFQESGLRHEELTNHNALSVIELWTKFNVNNECYQVFESESYFFNQFKNTDSTFSYVGINAANEVLFWFSIDKTSYYHEDKNDYHEVANVSMFAFSKIAIKQLIEIIMIKAMNLNFDLVVFQQNMPFIPELEHELRVVHGSQQWIYAYSSDAFNHINQFNINFY